MSHLTLAVKKVQGGNPDTSLFQEKKLFKDLFVLSFVFCHSGLYPSLKESIIDTELPISIEWKRLDKKM